MKKVLIVSLRVGAGHVKAAEAIEREIKQNYKNIAVLNIDFLDYASFLSNRFYGKLAVDVIGKLPELYAWLYKNADVSSSNEARLIFDRMNAQELKKKMLEFDPDIIVCTHFIPASLFVHWRKKYGYSYKIWATVTDFEAHKLWADPGVDCYSVATLGVKRSLVKNGVAENKIHILGIPIDFKFSKKYRKNILLKKYGLGRRFTIAIFSGGFGMGPVEEIYNALSSIDGNFQIVVVAGSNTKLKQSIVKLSKKSSKKTVVFGFTQQIEEIMAISDVVVTKPGGLTTSETLAMGLPMIASNPLPGQEEANIQFLISNKAAYRADDPYGVSEIVRIIMENPFILKKLKRSVRRIAKPYSTVQIVKKILK